MTMFRAVDSVGDWTFGQGKSNYLQKSAAIAADIRSRLKAILHDCFFADGEGIDWPNLLGTREKDQLSFSVRTTILNTDGVERISSMEVFDSDERLLTLSYEVFDTFGELILGTLSAPIAAFEGISKFVENIFFSGDVISVDVDVSSHISDATKTVWVVYDVANGYAPVLGAVQPTSNTTVRLTISPAPTGYFRLIGIE